MATVTTAHLGSWQSWIALFAYCVIATSSYLTLEMYTVFRPERAKAMLTSIRAWVTAHTDQVIIFGSLALGFWLIGNSIFLLVS